MSMRLLADARDNSHFHRAEPATEMKRSGIEVSTA